MYIYDFYFFEENDFDFFEVNSNSPECYFDSREYFYCYGTGIEVFEFDLSLKDLNKCSSTFYLWYYTSLDYDMQTLILSIDLPNPNIST